MLSVYAKPCRGTTLLRVLWSSMPLGGDASLARYERLPLSSVGRAVTKKQRFLSKPTRIMLAALSDCGRLRQDGNIRRKEIRVQMETCSSEDTLAGQPSGAREERWMRRLRPLLFSLPVTVPALRLFEESAVSFEFLTFDQGETN
ncbi:hypothetical protein BHM03_00051618 [Ensete ventricosum]|nr:hypothetical protein BHM03_00051618 [Ensete ventricosum]